MHSEGALNGKVIYGVKLVDFGGVIYEKRA